MKYKTLSKEEAYKAFELDSYTAEMTLVAGDKRFPFRIVSDACSWVRPCYGPELKSWMDATTVHHLITTGIAHIEAPEPEPADPFAHPALEGWSQRSSYHYAYGMSDPSADLFQIWERGSFCWSVKGGSCQFAFESNPTLAANLPEAAEIINRLAPDHPAEVVAAAVVAFVKYKEAGK